MVVVPQSDISHQAATPRKTPSKVKSPNKNLSPVKNLKKFPDGIRDQIVVSQISVRESQDSSNTMQMNNRSRLSHGHMVVEEEMFASGGSNLQTADRRESIGKISEVIIDAREESISEK